MSAQDDKMKAAGVSDAERQPCEIWTRVMGYHRPTTDWNKGKQAEHKLRKFFVEHKALPEQQAKVAAE